MRSNKIGSKLYLLTITAVIVVSVLVFSLAVNQHEKLYRDSVISHLQGLVENLADATLEPLVSEDNEVLVTAELLNLDSYPTVKMGLVYDENWRLVAQYVNTKFSATYQKVMFHAANASNFDIGHHLYSDDVYFLQKIGHETLPSGYLLLVSEYSAPLAESKQSLLFKVLPFLLLVVLAAILMTTYVQNILLHPLVKLAEFAKKIHSSKDYRLRLHIRGEDEVSSLGHSIMDMLDSLSDEIDKNKEQNRLLVEQQQALDKIAKFDVLTGLPNRQNFMLQLEAKLKVAKSKETNLAIMFLDLDGFKGVNDTLGHATGDLLLVEAAHTIQSCISDEVFFARLGGDEFLLLFEPPFNETTLKLVARNIINGMKKPFRINQWEVQSGISIGIAYADKCGYDLARLVSNADMAMYRAKESGRSTFDIFEESMLAENHRKLTIANSFGLALIHEELQVHYQPKVSAKGELIGFEALARWEHESLGTVSPAEFVPIVEQSGGISSLTEWLIEVVFKDTMTINKLHGGHLCVSLNLSPYDLKNFHLVDVVKKFKKKFQINPSTIEFEITESAYLDETRRAREFLLDIINMGFTIALDDFGTGYSSLSHLMQLKIHTLKLDKQFIEDLCVAQQNVQFTQSIIHMAHQLGLSVCAEGVENREQFKTLEKLGCEQMQGYLFGQAMPLAQIPMYIANFRPDEHKPNVHSII